MPFLRSWSFLRWAGNLAEAQVRIHSEIVEKVAKVKKLMQEKPIFMQGFLDAADELRAAINKFGLLFYHISHSLTINIHNQGMKLQIGTVTFNFSLPQIIIRSILSKLMISLIPIIQFGITR